MIPGLGLDKMLKFAPLMGKRLEDLVLSEIVDVMSAFNVKVDVNDELMEAGLALLRGQNIHSVADMIKSPDSIAQLLAFMQRGLGIAPDEFGSFEYTDPVLIQHEALPQYDVPKALIAPSPGWRLPY